VKGVESGWILLISVLLGWTLVGLVVAYLFGGLARRGEASEGTTLAPKVLSYLRRHKRANRPLRPSTHIKTQRTAGGRGRH
jgi:hypothetical protein